jgi:hypothetical protein
MAEETVYYQDNAVTITSTRAILGGSTYTMVNISSVKIGKKPPDLRPAIALGAIGSLCTACSACSFLATLQTASQQGSEAVGAIIGTGISTLLGLAIIGVAIFLFVMLKPKYIVRIGSASGETDGLISKDLVYVQTIVDAISTAIINRG